MTEEEWTLKMVDMKMPASSIHALLNAFQWIRKMKTESSILTTEQHAT